MNTTLRTNELPPPIQRYTDAWNSHNGQRIVDAFVPSGTYTDPLTSGPLAGDKIAHYAEDLWQSFPDLRFELDGNCACIGGTAFLPWKMLGTNSGAFKGLSPTGKSISLDGIDIISYTSEGIESVTGYFDSRSVPDQLGLQVLVLPHSVGPFTFGTSVRMVSGGTGIPQAFSVTSLEPRSPEEIEKIRQLARDTLKEMQDMEGFIAATAITCGNRQMTFSAWEKDEYISQIRNSKTHNEAMKLFYGDELAQGGTFSLWQALRVRSYQRCPQCNKMVSIEQGNGQCGCGTKVEMCSYW